MAAGGSQWPLLSLSQRRSSLPCGILTTLSQLSLTSPQVYLASWFGTEVAVKILIVGHVANASEAQRALSMSEPIMQQLQAEASLLASLRWVRGPQLHAACSLMLPCCRLLLAVDARVAACHAQRTAAEAFAVAPANPAACPT